MDGASLPARGELAKVFMMIFPWYFMGWLAAVLQVLDNLRKRSSRRSAARPGRISADLRGTA